MIASQRSDCFTWRYILKDKAGNGLWTNSVEKGAFCQPEFDPQNSQGRRSSWKLFSDLYMGVGAYVCALSLSPPIVSVKITNWRKLNFMPPESHFKILLQTHHYYLLSFGLLMVDVRWIPWITGSLLVLSHWQSKLEKFFISLYNSSLSLFESIGNEKWQWP